MARAPAVAKSRKRAPASASARKPSARVAVAVPDEAPPSRRAGEEPVWLVRSVLVLFLVGFAAFLAREVYNFVRALP